MLIEQKDIRTFYSRYKVAGVPAYILVDRAGNIVTMKAPRPSSENVSKEIRKILEEGV